MKHSQKLKPSVSELVAGIRAGDRVLLAKAITLVESVRREDLPLADELLSHFQNTGANGIRLGITGVPGVGKSTLIEALGSHIISTGLKLAVLTIDPSSPLTQGSILGDKTRMDQLSRNANAFIRPSASRNVLGGVAMKTYETMLLCEASGYDVTIIETVGVGQSEIEVKNMTDFFLLLMLAGGGDELQGIKKGIMEMADGIAITKADGNNIKTAQLAQATFKQALHLSAGAETNGWHTPVLTCSALEGVGVDKIWDEVLRHHEFLQRGGMFTKRRQQQMLHALHTQVTQKLVTDFNEYFTNDAAAKDIVADIQSGKLSPQEASRQLLSIFKRTR